MTKEMNKILLQNFKTEEIEHALFEINSLGFLGPSGFPTIFYQEN